VRCVSLLVEGERSRGAGSMWWVVGRESGVFRWPWGAPVVCSSGGMAEGGLLRVVRPVRLRKAW